MNAKESIMNGKAALGIEFGSTRIKAVLVDENCETLAVGGFHWENQLVDGIWTYSLDAIHSGLQACYAAVAKDVKEKYLSLIHISWYLRYWLWQYPVW